MYSWGRVREFKCQCGALVKTGSATRKYCPDCSAARAKIRDKNKKGA